MTTALCLAGDGARLPIKAGMLKAYAESGLQHDLLFGTSSGALAGALYHQGDLELLIETAMKIRNKDVFFFSPPWMSLGRQASFYNADPLHKLIRKVVKPNLLRSNPVPFLFNITNLSKLEHVAVDSRTATDEQIFKGLLTSASVPVAFPLQWWEGDAWCDGGLTNDYCVGQAVLAGAKRIILMTSLVAEERDPENWIDALLQTISAGIDCQMQREIALAQQAGVEVHVIRPLHKLGVGVLDFDYKDKQGLFSYGYTLAKQALERIAKDNDKA